MNAIKNDFYLNGQLQPHDGATHLTTTPEGVSLYTVTYKGQDGSVRNKQAPLVTADHERIEELKKSGCLIQPVERVEFSPEAPVLDMADPEAAKAFYETVSAAKEYPTVLSLRTPRGLLVGFNNLGQVTSVQSEFSLARKILLKELIAAMNASVIIRETMRRSDPEVELDSAEEAEPLEPADEDGPLIGELI